MVSTILVRIFSFCLFSVLQFYTLIIILHRNLMDYDWLLLNNHSNTVIFVFTFEFKTMPSVDMFQTESIDKNDTIRWLLLRSVAHRRHLYYLIDWNCRIISDVKTMTVTSRVFSSRHTTTTPWKIFANTCMSVTRNVLTRYRISLPRFVLRDAWSSWIINGLCATSDAYQIQ